MKDKSELVEMLEELDRKRARRDPVFFVTKYLQTFDPRPTAPEHDLDFELYPFQQQYVIDLVAAIRNGDDLLIEKSRDMGISWVTLAVLVWFWLYEPGFQALLGSRKEDFVDGPGMDALFPKLRYMLRKIKDPLLLPRRFDMRKHSPFLTLINPENGNTITGESANSDFGRAGRYTVALCDEGGFWRDLKSSWTALGESTLCRILITTPPDKPSYAKFIRFNGLTRVLTFLWRLHPLKDDSWYEYQKTKKTAEEMMHEIDISWEYSKGGRPYPEADTLPFGKHEYDPDLPLYVSIDLGRDAVALGYWQPVRNSKWLTLVDAYENSNKIIDWYVPFLGGDVDSQFTDYTDDDLAFINKIKYWRKPIFYGDPSGNQKHIESERSAYTVLKEDYGIIVNSNTMLNDFPSRRDETKRLLMNTRVNDTPGTRYWHTCITSAVYPERSETSQSTTETNKPVHDWTSHHRTQTEFFAVNYKKPTTMKPKRPQRRPRPLNMMASRRRGM